MERKKGLMVSEIAFANLPIILKNVGMDYFILDYEHGAFDYSDLSKIIMNAKLSNIKCIVRIPNNQRKDIIKIMDMGADGLLLPMTSFKEDIKQVVKYSKYPPLGNRGISTMRAHTLYNPSNVLDYIKQANQETMVFAQIETVNGVNNVKEILSVEGVSGAFVGPNDLSADYGCLGDSNSSYILDAIEKVAKEAKLAHKISGIITNNNNYLTKAKQCKMEYYSVGSELNLLKDGSKKIVDKIEEN